MTKPPLVVCYDERHAYLCRQPCPACREECDKNKQRLATEEEEILYESGEDDPGFIGIVNPGK